MSSNHNDSSNQIHLGNYEEFFLLYTDGELSEAQMNMVDSFVAQHPDLRAELELLLDTRLTPETFSFDKDMLMADKMQLPSANEELLLYLDQELPAEQKHVVELELSANQQYANLYSQLQKAKLDASEVVRHPNKNELYKRTGSIVAFRPWMRVAAAVILIAGATAIYTTTNRKTSSDSIAVVTPKGDPAVSGEKNTVGTKIEPKQPTSVENAVVSTPAETAAITVKNNRKFSTVRKALPEPVNEVKDEIVQAPRIRRPETVITTTGDPDIIGEMKDFQLPKSDLINKSPVTISSSDPLNSIVTAAGEIKASSPVASNEKKGSVKGFLRKATRLIEKKTGIDPTNDGELLIGVVAVNLK